ncbi:glycosyltransferase family 8 protein [Paenibacillus sp.]|uniref:glycosyltransferase family 8 protein n=1 Tax=Paenibacillus sp. TaxID=58172 RepID=UPI002D486B7E|nr:glycosyltransferase family 8 protein [Paenibacillus sp.]HZG84985.1 glycosyltransferase family 8 protein [Paenibacillus sp.]
MHIAMASDDNYVQHMAVAICSVLENNKDTNLVTFHILDNGIRIENKKRLLNLVNSYKREIVFYDFSNMEEKFGFIAELSEPPLPIVTYARIFLPEILPKNICKVLYMDVDMVCAGSLKELWNTEFKGNLIAGVLDTAPPDTKLKVGLDKDSVYVNAGMLMINIEQWRREEITKQLVEFIELHKGKVFHNDQGTINGIMSNRTLVLHPRYNVLTTYFMISYKKMVKRFKLEKFYSPGEIRGAIERPIIIHFVVFTTTRPWEENCRHPKQSLYKYYLNMTEWKNEKLKKDKRSIKNRMVHLLYEKTPIFLYDNILKLYQKIKN